MTDIPISKVHTRPTATGSIEAMYIKEDNHIEVKKLTQKEWLDCVERGYVSFE